MSTTRIDLFDKLPSLSAVATAAGVAAPYISPERHGRPFTMILVVTRRCNSRCKMCFIWQEKKSPMLSLDQYRQIFREPLPSIRALALSGGEPTLRADLPEIWAIARPALPQLEYGLLATSGLNVQRTLDQVKQIMQQIEDNPGRMKRFEVQVSLDGIDETHDHVRGIAGFFTRVQRTLAGLAELQQRYPMLAVKLSTVVLPENVEDVERIHNFAREHGIPVHFSPAVLTGTYFSNLDNAEEIGFVPESEKSLQAQAAFRKLSDEDTSSLRFYYDDMTRMLNGAPRSRICLMGYFGCVVEHTGEVYPCPIWEYESFGNLLEQSFDDVWFSEQAQSARYKLRKTGCPTCSSMCYPHAVGLNEVLQEKVMNVQRKAKRVAGRLLKV
jgi:radical SAM protein with 4Fe4S-binding SPASM domain